MTRVVYANVVDFFISKIKVNKVVRRFIAKYFNYFILFTVLMGLYLLNSKAFIVILFFAVCVLSMQHLRYFSWLGAPDMNLILTAYTSINYGLPAGLLLGSASFFGLILSGDIDSNIFYDLIFSYATAVIASFFSMGYFIPLIITLAIIHLIGFIIFHKIVGTLDAMNLSWVVTHMLWIIFFTTKVCKLFGLC
jgi:hypothetical protein